MNSLSVVLVLLIATRSESASKVPVETYKSVTLEKEQAKLRIKKLDAEKNAALLRLESLQKERDALKAKLDEHSNKKSAIWPTCSDGPVFYATAVDRSHYQLNNNVAKLSFDDLAARYRNQGSKATILARKCVRTVDLKPGDNISGRDFSSALVRLESMFRVTR